MGYVTLPDDLKRLIRQQLAQGCNASGISALEAIPQPS